MRLNFVGRPAILILLVVFSLNVSSRAQAAGNTEDRLAGTVKLVLARNFNTDWQGLETLPGIKWAPLPPRMLQNCLPDGGCFTRQGAMTIGGKDFVVLATGARTIVANLYLRNTGGTPVGELPVLAALKRAGLSAELARCPVGGSSGGTNWYRLKGVAENPGVLAIQSSCAGRPCEGFTLTQGADLPPLQPNQLRLYSEQCTGTSAAARQPVSTTMPPEELAHAFASLLVPPAGPALYSWGTLPSLLPSAQWSPGGAKKWDLSDKGDLNPMAMSGEMKLAQRSFSVLASGSASDVNTVYLEEEGMHPSGENTMGELYKLGYAVRLVRCGPIYTESTNNWYSATSTKSRPAMIKQSIRYEGRQVQDAYELRLDGALPSRDPRDRDPGVNGCR